MTQMRAFYLRLVEGTIESEKDISGANDSSASATIVITWTTAPNE